MKKLFIIAPHFPPSSLPPAQRVRLYIRHLSSLGWWPVVFTIEHKYREELADPWMNTITGKDYDLKILKCLDPKKTRKFKFGDLGLRMLPFIAGPLIKQIKEQKPDFVLYPVPPWYIMIVAPYIKSKTGVPFVIDFIDPWVHNDTKPGFKAKASMWVAKMLEGYVVKKSDAIVAVSAGILNDIKTRYPQAKNIPMEALPYGVELSDYDSIRASTAQKQNDKITIRYIGAISNAMLPVAGVLLEAFAEVKKQFSLQIQFIGTSYAGGGLATSNLQTLIEKTGTQDCITEQPNRIEYKQALELTMQSDLLFLIGDTTKYYAASKLMGLIASGKPFIAFLHKESFPRIFLQKMNYPYLVAYGDDTNGPASKKNELLQTIIEAINNRQSFQPLDTTQPEFVAHTAFGMTQKLTNLLNKVTDEC